MSCSIMIPSVTITMQHNKTKFLKRVLLFLRKDRYSVDTLMQHYVSKYMYNLYVHS